MALISWGKPKLEIAKILSDGSLDAWQELATPKKGSTKMNTEKGDKKVATLEGGGILDVKTDKNKYNVEFELYAVKGTSKPIADNDGVINEHYSFRLTPEDDTVPGFLFDKTSVSVENTWDAEDGEKWKYTFEALEPNDNSKICKPYTAP